MFASNCLFKPYFLHDDGQEELSLQLYYREDRILFFIVVYFYISLLVVNKIYCLRSYLIRGLGTRSALKRTPLLSG